MVLWIENFSGDSRLVFDWEIQARVQVFPVQVSQCYLTTFFSRKYHFLSYFLSCPPPEILKSQKKEKFSDFGPRPPYEFLDTRLRPPTSERVGGSQLPYSDAHCL